jgi:hypothetical protein
MHTKFQKSSSIFGGVTARDPNLLQPLWHTPNTGIYKHLRHLLPDLLCCLKHLVTSSGTSGQQFQLPFEVCPAIFDWIKVWGVGRGRKVYKSLSCSYISIFCTCMQPDIVLNNSGTSIAPPARVDTVPAALEFGFGDLLTVYLCGHSSLPPLTACTVKAHQL